MRHIFAWLVLIYMLFLDWQFGLCVLCLLGYMDTHHAEQHRLTRGVIDGNFVEDCQQVEEGF